MLITLSDNDIRLLLSLVEALITRENRIMATFDDALAAIAAERTAERSIVALLNQTRQLLQDALANAGGLTPAQQTALDEVFKQATDNAAELNAAINNVGPGPEPSV